ncbi:MAG: competence/damage-inducible protein A [Bacteroidales bacterium]|nr:competence/damage-inducible protein A [Bacteroidales bacterium]
MMKAEIINIGDEILIGQIVNSNASWMAQQLYNNGITLCRQVVVSDEEGAIMRALNDAQLQADLILITGGLGPTNDDITKKVMLRYFNDTLKMDEDALNHIRKFFERRNLPLTEVNRQQAMLPSRCKKLHNTLGTAPGMWVEHEAKVFVFMPGVPFEMKALMTDYVIPEVVRHFPIETNLIHKTILTTGLGESLLAEKISDWERDLPQNMKLAYLPQPGIVRLRLSVISNEKSKAKLQLDLQFELLQEIIPDLIFGVDDQTLEGIIGEKLTLCNGTIATAESCTGGYISHLITSIPGSSNYFKGSVVAYSNDIKENVLKVSNDDLVKYGAVSEQVVKQMAVGVMDLFQTDFAIATSGIAGPDGGTEDKPVGTVWIAIASKNKVFAEKYNFGTHRDRNVKRSSIAALNALRLFCL